MNTALFPLSAIMDKAMNICVEVLVWTYIFTSLEYTPGSGLAGPAVTLCLLPGGTARLFQSSGTTWHSHQVCEVQFLHVLVNTCHRLSACSPTGTGVKRELIAGLTSVSLMPNSVAHLSSCAYWPFVHLLWRMSSHILCPFKFFHY